MTAPIKALRRGLPDRGGDFFDGVDDEFVVFTGIHTSIMGVGEEFFNGMETVAL